ncbi:FAD-dependent oxidoreductase [Pseudonocardia endophytica]|uniref:Fumarate reductase flavoprotein subunit/3-oxo-5alpha-steroid 4-dehydrogenase n=1 Tax=Pseudonocardia endophytica TaxID=401976 RepID=A0A4R1HYX6_PSEEN|nr:FAD-binding protein [Pseudonocardia endophytica]TCK26385.1 fumarate reductase flavoprotein subunit/3-oxo-5alpha-steroid 4-dehydrogenase [Pseudonocardia endophytica]
MGAPERWDADVVVLGTGAAGMAAVSAAALAGADVVAVDACDDIGGNAVRSTGYVVVVGSDGQRAAGLDDDEETFLADARARVEAAGSSFGVEWDERLAGLFVRESPRAERFLVSRGVRFRRFVPRPAVNTVDRLAAVEDVAMLADAFRPDFARPNVATLHRTLADRLVTDGRRVTGVRVHDRDTGAEREIGARSGVVLATGGYQANPDLRRRYQPARAASSPYLGLDTCRGAGHLMGQAVGGDLVNMTALPPLVMVSSSLVEDAIAVNSDGVRFHDEAGPTDERVLRLRAQPGGRAWYVVDGEVAAEKARLIGGMPSEPVRADTLAGLADRIGVPSAALQDTVDGWNTFLDSGSATDLHGRVVLPPGRRRCARPPFTAVAMVEGVNFPYGGFRTTTDMQVLDVFGDPVPALFAAGDCAGGLNACAELGGIHLGGGFALGRVAGLAAATGSAVRPVAGRTS